MKKLVRMILDSPAGEVLLVASDEGVVAILWNAERYHFAQAREDASHPVLRRLVAQLEEYFAGRRTRFDLPLDMQGTEFQKRVWSALLEIPYGATKTYGQIAAGLGKPSASRAVGMANGRNPISILVPCHRVIGANGTLTGYAGGLKSKEYLLSLEKRSAQMEFAL